jgi:multiple sugar transport system ATP-binding protein
MSAVELRHVVKRYGKATAIDDLSMEVADSELVTIVGSTGCGKSTVLRLIGGLETVSSGAILFDGKPVDRVVTRERNVAMVSQEYALYPHLNVYDNIAFPLRHAKEFRRTDIDPRVREIVGRLGLEAVVDHMPRDLAVGERQRVALGRAIVRDAGVLLFDEPLSNVDAAMRPSMLREIRDVHDRLNVTTFYVTHDHIDALRIGDRVAVLDGGRLQQIGTPYELLNEPANTFVAGFVGSPPMSFVAARLIGDLVHLPFGLVRLPAERLARVAAGGTFLAGVRPEYADDAMVLDPADDDLVQITAAAMGVPSEMAEFERDLAGLHSRSIAGDSASTVATALVDSLRAEGLMPPGREDRVFVDTRKIHLFDPSTGENLTRAAG